MLDRSREWINQNSASVTVAAVAVLLGSMTVIMNRHRRTGGVEPGEAWYYDTVTKEYFRDKTTKIAPFNRDNGNEAVRAHFFTCGECTEATLEDTPPGERFIGYYEKYTDEVKAKLEEKSESFALYEMAFQGRLYSRDGQEWFAAEKTEGTAITAELQKKCPPKKLRYCPPQ